MTPNICVPVGGLEDGEEEEDQQEGQGFVFLFGFFRGALPCPEDGEQEDGSHRDELQGVRRYPGQVPKETEQNCNYEGDECGGHN